MYRNAATLQIGGRMRRLLALAVTCSGFCTTATRAEAPVASYIFPAGGQRGKVVPVRVGGLFLGRQCSFEMLGPGVKASKHLEQTITRWLEGPLLPLPDSQQAEDYPKDWAGQVEITADAPLGSHHWRLWNAQGATSAMKFEVGDFPEIVESEIEGDPLPVPVQLPVTINGRVFPREDVDIWSFDARKGQSIACDVSAARLGSPLDSHLEVLDPKGRRIAENDDAHGVDSFLRFTAPIDGVYQVRIRDTAFKGGQAYVYRLTLTADPYVESVYPLGARRGSKTTFELTGQGCSQKPVEIMVPATGDAYWSPRFTVAGKLTNPVTLDLDDLPEFRESEPNDLPSQASVLSLPAIANGRIGEPGDRDCWAFPLRKGERCAFELRAGRLGSPLNGVLTLLDPAGNELAHASGSAGTDPSLSFTAPADGAYVVRVEDRFASRGGSSFAYRLRLDRAPQPDFELHLSTDALSIPRGGEAKLKLAVERRGGYAGPVALSVEGLSGGVTAEGVQIAAQEGAVEITFKADKSALIQALHLRIKGAARIDQRLVTRVASFAPPGTARPLDSVLLAVTIPTPFKVVGGYDMHWAARGTVYRRRFRIHRNGFNGPIRVCLADRQARHLQGIAGPMITVPAGVDTFEYPVSLPPWMEVGRTARACIMAVGVVKDSAGREHEVSYCSTDPNEQLIAVVEPGWLGVEALRGTIQAAPGRSVVLPVRISRGKVVHGSVEVRIIAPAHLSGVTADTVKVPASTDSAMLVLHFDPQFHDPCNAPLLIRATAIHNGDPIVAETKVELLQDP
jgi:hypothetical protein